MWIEAVDFSRIVGIDSGTHRVAAVVEAPWPACGVASLSDEIWATVCDDAGVSLLAVLSPDGDGPVFELPGFPKRLVTVGDVVWTPLSREPGGDAQTLVAIDAATQSVVDHVSVGAPVRDVAIVEDDHWVLTPSGLSRISLEALGA